MSYFNVIKLSPCTVWLVTRACCANLTLHKSLKCKLFILVINLGLDVQLIGCFVGVNRFLPVTPGPLLLQRHLLNQTLQTIR